MTDFKANFGSGWVNAKPVVRNGTNTGWQDAEAYTRNDANTAWIQVWPTTTPISITGATNYFSTGAVGGHGRSKNATTTLSVSGGTGTYSYAWTKTTEFGDGTATSCSNASILNPTFSSFIPADGSQNSDWRLTVTSGSATATYDVNIDLTN